MLVTTVIVVMVLLTVATSMIAMHRVQVHSSAYREMTDGMRMSMTMMVQDVRNADLPAVVGSQRVDVIGPMGTEVQYEFQPSLDQNGDPIPNEVTLWRSVNRTYDSVPLLAGLSPDSAFEQVGSGVRMILKTAARPGTVSQTVTTVAFPQGSP